MKLILIRCAKYGVKILPPILLTVLATSLLSLLIGSIIFNGVNYEHTYWTAYKTALFWLSIVAIGGWSITGLIIFINGSDDIFDHLESIERAEIAAIKERKSLEAKRLEQLERDVEDVIAMVNK